MSSEIKKQLELVEENISRDKLQEAKKIIEEVLSKDEITEEEEILGTLLKGEVLVRVGDFEEAIEISNKVFKIAKKNNNQLAIIDANNIKALALLLAGKPHEGLKLFRHLFFLELL